MNSRMSPEEARNAKIKDLMAKKMAARLALIAAGDAKAIHDAANDVFDYLSYSKDAERLITGEITFEQVRNRVLENDAEVEAIKEVEAIERYRAEESIAARAERWLWNHGVLV